MFPKDTRILIVDDMKTIRALLRASLQTLGFKDIVDFTEGQSAWASLEVDAQSNRPIELIISDWMMPKMSGMELLQKVRGHVTMKGVPFIILSAESEINQIKEAIAAGVSNYITKPFTTNTIQAKLEAVYAKTAKRVA